jgi:uncharacterized protein (DUF1786 family)
MKILTVDIGTGTQDIFLYDSQLEIENGYKLVMPSPTMIVNHSLRRATRRRDSVVLTGVTMGGGPSAWAAEAHVKSGNRLYATPDAARSFNDDLDEVAKMGILIISEEDVQHLPDQVLRLKLGDFDFNSIHAAFSEFGLNLNDLAAVAVAVFDHGAAPPEVSDRQFRFDYLDQRIRSENRLSAFAYLSNQIPEVMTRLQAVANSAENIGAPLVVMDTAPAAVLGACLDQVVLTHQRNLIANVGNFHTLAFRLGPRGIEGVFEHHTGLLTPANLELLLRKLSDGSLTHQDVFDHHGHGALIYSRQPLLLENSDFNVVVTGPRRNMLFRSPLNPYFAVPFGDMMLAGCFGLLSATADLLTDLKQPILDSFNLKGGGGKPPWEIPVE